MPEAAGVEAAAAAEVAAGVAAAAAVAEAGSEAAAAARAAFRGVRGSATDLQWTDLGSLTWHHVEFAAQRVAPASSERDGQAEWPTLSGKRRRASWTTTLARLKFAPWQSKNWRFELVAMSVNPR